MLGNRQIDEQKAREHFLSSRAKQKEKDSADETELRALKKRLFELDKLIASTFEEKVLGSLPENVCKDLCEKFFSEKESASRRISDLEKSLQQDSGGEEEAEKYLLRLKQYANCEDLTREMCLLLIDKIVVGEKSMYGTPRKIDIYYKFSAPKQSP